jgi:hypothetical protein
MMVEPYLSIIIILSPPACELAWSKDPKLCADAVGAAEFPRLCADAVGAAEFPGLCADAVGAAEFPYNYPGEGGALPTLGMVICCVAVTNSAVNAGIGPIEVRVSGGATIPGRLHIRRHV